MDCIYIALFYLSGSQTFLASRSPIHLQGATLPIGRNLRFNVLLKDTLAHSVEELGQTTNLAINTPPQLYPLTHSHPED